MGLNKEVLNKAKVHAAEISNNITDSSFLAHRYSGKALEKDHLVTEELTEYGLKEMNIILPPLIAFNNIMVNILEDPRTANAFYTAMTPMFEITSAITGIKPLPDEQVVTKIREDRNRWLDLLNLNKEKVSNPQSVRRIDAKGNILE